MRPWFFGRETKRHTRMVHQTRVMRFRCEVSDGTEYFTAHWVDGGDGVVHRRAFEGAPALTAWLLDDQRYGESEADALIEQLREPCRPFWSHLYSHRSRYAVQ